MMIIGFLVFILVVIIIGVTKFFDSIDTNKEVIGKKVVKNKIKEIKISRRKKMKKFMKVVKAVVKAVKAVIRTATSWVISKIYSVNVVEANVAGFRTVAPVANKGVTVVVAVLDRFHIPFRMELWKYITCKIKINLVAKINKLIKQLKREEKEAKKIAKAIYLLEVIDARNEQKKKHLKEMKKSLKQMLKNIMKLKKRMKHESDKEKVKIMKKIYNSQKSYIKISEKNYNINSMLPPELIENKIIGLESELKYIKNKTKKILKALKKAKNAYSKIGFITKIKLILIKELKDAFKILSNERGSTMLPALVYQMVINKKENISMEPMKNPLKYLEKVEYAIIFHNSYDTEKKERVYAIDIMEINKLKEEAETNKEAKAWLQEFYKKLPQKTDIERKREYKKVYDSATFGAKILHDTLRPSRDGLYNIYLLNSKGEKEKKQYTEGGLIALSIKMLMNRYNNLHKNEEGYIPVRPSWEMGPQKVMWYHKENILETILNSYDLWDDYLKLGVFQKQTQRIHKFMAPLTLLPKAKVYTSKSWDKEEGIIYVSKTYAKKANLVEGAKTAFTLKSLIHIVPDHELKLGNIATKKLEQFDVAIGADENKWKLSALRLNTILNAFTDKVPAVNARTMKTMVLKENAMCFAGMYNNLKPEHIKLFDMFKMIKENYKNIFAKDDDGNYLFVNEDGTEFKPEVEKILFDLLSIVYFNKEDEDASDKIYVLYDKACRIFNKKYIKYSKSYIENGELKYEEHIRFEKGNGKVYLDYEIIKEVGDAVARYIKSNTMHAHLMGASGTAFPLEYATEDAYPISWNVTNSRKYRRICKQYNKFERICMYKYMSKIYYTTAELEEALSNAFAEIIEYKELHKEDIKYKEYVETQNAKLEKLGISKNMMYVQRHPSVLGVWTKLLYSPSTKLFYIDSKLWQTFFGGDFDGDTFTALYPYHPLNAEKNNLTQKLRNEKEPRKIVDPIDNIKMVQLIYNNKDSRKFLIKLPRTLHKIDNSNGGKFLIKLVNKLNMQIQIANLNTAQNKVQAIMNSNMPVPPEKSLAQKWAEMYNAQRIVGKIHSLVCSTLIFYTKSLDVLEELVFSTYFILKYVQPAISGLKHDDKADVPELKDLIEEMSKVYIAMFPEKAKNVKYITLEKVLKHQDIYKLVRKFNTIAHKESNQLDENGDGIYFYDDLYYHYRKHIEFLDGVKGGNRRDTVSTYWTTSYRNLLNAAALYERVIFNTNDPENPDHDKFHNNEDCSIEPLTVEELNAYRIIRSMTPVENVKSNMKPIEHKIEIPKEKPIEKIEEKPEEIMIEIPKKEIKEETKEPEQIIETPEINEKQTTDTKPVIDDLSVNDSLVISDEWKAAKEAIEKRENIFIHGKAGTGKSTFLRWITTVLPLKLIKCATTGIAAVNIGGKTVHSTFKLFIQNNISYEQIESNFIDGLYYNRINRPCDILVHRKGNYAYVNWKENPQFTSPYDDFKD